MKLEIPKTVLAEMINAARQAAPLEACGLLGGVGERVSRCYSLTNADVSEEHFSMMPAEQFAAAKDMRQRGLTLLAIWHSHPASPARMSAEDLKLAFTTEVAYVIVSLAKAPAPDCRAFTVDGGISRSVEVVLTDE